MNRNLNTTLLFFLILSFFSCQAQNGQDAYREGVVNAFEVYEKINDNSDFRLIDTLSVEIQGKGLLGRLFGMNMSYWTSTSNTSYSEKRGFNISEGEAELQTPLQRPYLDGALIAIAPYPSYSSAWSKGTSSISEHHYPKSYGALNGKVINQYKELMEEAIKTPWKGSEVECVFVEGYNTSLIEEYGQYFMRSYYNKEHGFILIQFTFPDGRLIELRRI